MKMTLICTALLATALAGCGGAALPDDDAVEALSVSVSPEMRTRWKGEAADGTGYRFVHEGGVSWEIALLKSRKKPVVHPYTEVTRTQGYIELEESSGNRRRVRLCEGKLLFNKGKQEWLEIAKGGWVEKWGD